MKKIHFNDIKKIKYNILIHLKKIIKWQFKMLTRNQKMEFLHFWFNGKVDMRVAIYISGLENKNKYLLSKIGFIVFQNILNEDQYTFAFIRTILSMFVNKAHGEY